MSESDSVLDALSTRIPSVFSQKLVGIYLYGSLVWGGFDPEVSDLDLMVAVSSEISDDEFEALLKMHGQVIVEFPTWKNRIEVAYLTTSALRTFKTQTSLICAISPGEPLNRKQAGLDWLINWYLTRERSSTLSGPPPQTLIEPISRTEFVENVVNQAQAWKEQVENTKDSVAYQSYAVLTMCRALHVHSTGEQVSKQKAANWAQKQLPTWSDLIEKSLEWRLGRGRKELDPKDTFGRTKEFVYLVADQITAS